MADVVFTVAVWDVARRSWVALATSPDRCRVEALEAQLNNHVMVFTQIVGVPRDDDDAVVAALGMLPKVHPRAVAATYTDLAMWCVQREDDFDAMPKVN